jgi:hypothetical protein
VCKRKRSSAAEAGKDLIAQFVEDADLPRLARFQGGIDEPVPQRPVEKSVSRKLQCRLHRVGKETIVAFLFRRDRWLRTTILRVHHGS